MTNSEALASVELRDASRWYGNVVAVNAITCTLAPGITGLLGPNGAGKSTVLHMIAGLLAPSAGQVLIDGQRAAENPQIYKKLGLVPEREAVQPFLTGFEFVLMNAKLQQLPNPDDAARRAIALVDLESAMNRRVGGYSKGMRQRVKIAGALVHDPSVLLLDEPFNGMDPRQRLHMMEMLHGMATRGCTVLISSHILEELNDLAASVLVMVAGRLAASGHYREIRKLMTNRPHTFTLKSTNDRKLAAELISEPSVQSVDIADSGLAIRTSDRGLFTRALPRRARGAGVTVRELLPTDESLESVFNYLVKKVNGPINMTVAGLTFRQLFTRKRFIATAIFSLVPLLFVLIFRMTPHAFDPNGDAFFARILAEIVAFVLLPLSAVVFGTAAFGGEIDDGTIVYLLVKTIPRWTLVLSKFVVAMLSTTLMMLVAVILPWLALGAHSDQLTLVRAYATAIALGSALYSAIFVTLGMTSKRALVLGLLYIVVLEITLSSSVAGLKSLSVREFVMTVVGQIAVGNPNIHPGAVPMNTVWTMGGIFLFGALGLGIRWLSRYELAERL